MPKGKILVVDNNKIIQETVRLTLANKGYAVTLAESGEEALLKTSSEIPDVIVLDKDMPGVNGMDGIQTCQEIRKKTFAPIIFLSNCTTETDVVLALGVGGDYCIAKPVRPAEILAYVDAAARRETVYAQANGDQKKLKIKDMTIDLLAHEVSISGKAVQLTATEFRLIKTFVQHADQVLSRSQLLDHVWDISADGVYSRTVDVHIGRIRKKIEKKQGYAQYIVTVPGLGYKMPSK